MCVLIRSFSLLGAVCSMKRLHIAALTGVLLFPLAGCSREHESPSIIELVDRIREKHPAPRHRLVPSPQRYAEVMGKPRDEGLEPQSDPDIDELIRRGQAAVPTLSATLEDLDRRLVAAYVLAEIGGAQAADLLWQKFTGLAEDTRTVRVYRHGMNEEGEPVVFAEGEYYEGPDPELYSELAFGGLCYAGKPVVEEIIAFTKRAIDRTDALHKQDAPLAHERLVFRDGQRHTETWRSAPLERAQRGIWILGHLGDERAVDVFNAALRSPVQALRSASIQSAAWLQAKETLDALGASLDDKTPHAGDMRICDLALEAVAFVMHRRTVRTDNMSWPERDQMIEVYRMRLKR
jgi:hypothetical protein